MLLLLKLEKTEVFSRLRDFDKKLKKRMGDLGAFDKKPRNHHVFPVEVAIIKEPHVSLGKAATHMSESAPVFSSNKKTGWHKAIQFTEIKFFQKYHRLFRAR